ncbi:MAG TPA: outer membrane lipoprotein-sorting protein [Calditrichia bacterium]|nr:outer membrane lipoprotein-sorting protein [Calditrichia bacterium]
MMRKSVIFLALLGWAAGLLAGDFPDGQEILRKVDENIRARNRVVTAKMVIGGRRGNRTIVSKTWAEGDKRSFTEYLSPAREKGTKMLKLEDELWTYPPATDRTIRISGHMLRQSVMGSDLSYEDMMEADLLSDAYQAEVIADTTLGERPVWVLELTARGKDVSYARRRVWVDRERYLALREERFASGGKLLKRTEVEGVMRVDERWVVSQVRFKDMLKSGEGTLFIIEEVAFDVDIPASRFSKAALKR